jgi:transposase
MRALTEFQGVFLHRDPVDMRKGINGLSEIVQMAKMGDLMGPYLFVFCGRRRDLLKLIYFDKSGFAMWQKRLEKNRFKWPQRIEEEAMSLTPEQFNFLLDGYDILKMRPFESLKFTQVC